MNLTYEQKEYVLDSKQIRAEHKSFQFQHGNFEARELGNTWKSILTETLRTDTSTNDFTMNTAVTVGENRKIADNRQKDFHTILGSTEPE